MSRLHPGPVLYISVIRDSGMLSFFILFLSCDMLHAYRDIFSSTGFLLDEVLRIWKLSENNGSKDQYFLSPRFGTIYFWAFTETSPISSLFHNKLHV